MDLFQETGVLCMLGILYIFHAMSHEKAGRYIGKLLEVDIIGKAKAGVAKVKFTRLGV